MSPTPRPHSAGPIQLRISPAVAAEWQIRCIGDVVQGLRDRSIEPGLLEVDHATAKEILADCEYYTDPDGPDTTVGERSAYSALARQCRLGLASPASGSPK